MEGAERMRRNHIRSRAETRGGIIWKREKEIKRRKEGNGAGRRRNVKVMKRKGEK